MWKIRKKKKFDLSFGCRFNKSCGPVLGRLSFSNFEFGGYLQMLDSFLVDNV